jgi:hypothetical protein
MWIVGLHLLEKNSHKSPTISKKKLCDTLIPRWLDISTECVRYFTHGPRIETMCDSSHRTQSVNTNPCVIYLIVSICLGCSVEIIEIILCNIVQLEEHFIMNIG